jgi:NADH-quinone oxidoreductase subunit C
MTALTAEAIGQRAKAAFPQVQPLATENGQPFLQVAAADVQPVLRFLRDEKDLRFDALMDLTGYDLLKYPMTPPSDAIAVVYLLWSHVHKHRATVKVLAPRADCRVGTASGVWPAALYFEREVWDLLGVRFEGHPSLKRIMTPEDWTGHPLRKDYAYPSDYHGVPHLRDGQHFEQGPVRPGVAVAADAKPPVPEKTATQKGSTP